MTCPRCDTEGRLDALEQLVAQLRETDSVRKELEAAQKEIARLRGLLVQVHTDVDRWYWEPEEKLRFALKHRVLEPLRHYGFVKAVIL